MPHKKKECNVPLSSYTTTSTYLNGYSATSAETLADPGPLAAREKAERKATATSTTLDAKPQTNQEDL